MAKGTPGTPDGTDTPDAEPKKPRWYKRVPWAKVGKYGLPVALVLIAAIAVIGLLMPSEARDPTARSGVATETTARTTADTNLEQKLGGKAAQTALDTLTQDTKSRDDDLQASIDLLPTKTDVTTEIGAAVSTETQARTDGDSALSALVESVARALHDPANPTVGVVGRLVAVETTVNDPTTGVVGRLGAVEAAVAPPPPVPPPDQVGHRVLHPVY
jgi:hypothetical protein